MSSYYGNLLQANLPPAPVTSATPGAAPGETYLGHEGKYEGSFYGSPGQPGLGFEGDMAVQHPGFPRFPPYDRMEIRPINSKGQAPAYTTSGGTYQATTLPSYTFPSPPNGQYSDEVTGCKLSSDPPHTAAILGSSNTGTGGQTASPGMINPFQGPNGLTGIVNGLGSHPSPAAQNVPIYPWMRPMNGGKSQTSQEQHWPTSRGKLMATLTLLPRYMDHWHIEREGWQSRDLFVYIWFRT